MSKSTEKVAAILSHNQEIDGRERKAGEKVELDPRLARVLKARGSIQIEADEEEMDTFYSCLYRSGTFPHAAFELDETPVCRNIYMVYQRKGTLSELTKAFIALMRAGITE